MEFSNFEVTTLLDLSSGVDTSRLGHMSILTYKLKGYLSTSFLRGFLTL